MDRQKKYTSSQFRIYRDMVTNKEISAMRFINPAKWFTLVSRTSRRLPRCLIVLAFTGLGMAAVPTTAGAEIATTAIQINGTGSSFASPAIQTWVEHVTTAPYSLSMNWAASNSGTGRYEFTNQTTDFAVSDIGYVGNTDTTPPSFPFKFIPITAGGIAFMYNLPGLTKQLQLSSYTVCGLLTGGITMWNNSAIAADNPGVTLPATKVIPVTESDSAGTNYVLEEWCIDEQPTLWADFANAQNSQSGGPSDGVEISATAPNSNWPQTSNGLNDITTTAVASDVSTNQGAIGAVQVKYAEEESGYGGSDPTKNVALVKNASGDYTAPTPVDVASALAYASQLPDGTHQLNFGGLGKYVYNPSTYSYLLTPTTGWSAGKGDTMSQFVNYALTLGQQIAPSFGYASLGLSLEQYGITEVKQFVPGAVAPTAAEQSAYSCGDLTPTEVAAGQTTATCGVVTSTAPLGGADSGTATGSATPPGGGTSSSTGAGGSSSSGTSGTSGSSSKTSTSATSKSTTGTTAKSGSGGTLSALGSTGSSSDSGGAGADPAVSLGSTAAMPNTGGNPVPLTILGAGLFMAGMFGRRKILNRRRSVIR
jgi:phosphate transport system substrate-binding protein